MFNFKKKTHIILCMYQFVYQNTIYITFDILHNLYTYTNRIFYCYDL